MSSVHTCLVLAASVCINEPAKVDVVRSSIWSGANISIGIVAISSSLGSDNVTTPNKSLMAKSCVSSKCFYYTRHCSVEFDGERCKFYYTIDGISHLRKIEFTAPSMQDIEKIWQTVRFAPYTDVYKKFSEMTFDNGSDLPPIDRSRPQR